MDNMVKSIGHEEYSDILFSDMQDNISHGILVSNLTYLTAQKMGLDEGTCYELAIAGLLHDIGKLRLAGYLYGRSDGLKVEEIQYMRMHSKLGYDILQYYDFSTFVLQSVLYHHENYDGTGYPENLEGEEIPFGARVIKVADNFAALISDRPYRKAFDIEAAIDIMIEEIKIYDVEVFIAFQKVINDSNSLDVIRKNKLSGNEEITWHLLKNQ